MSRKWLIFVLLVLAVIVLDQTTKYWVFNNIDYRFGSISVIPGVFDIVHAQNPGALAGFLRNFEYRHYVFLSFTVFAIGIVVQMVYQLNEDERFLPVALSLIAGGALGNAWDRVDKGTVTDFLRVYSENEAVVGFLRKLGIPPEWPSFNVADMALVIGVGMFMVHYLFLEEPEEEGQQKGTTPKPDSEAATGGLKARP